MARKPLRPHYQVFRHYRGGLYRVLFDDARCSDTGVTMVVYASLENGHIFTRSLAQWTEAVAWPDGRTQARFLKGAS